MGLCPYYPFIWAVRIGPQPKSAATLFRNGRKTDNSRFLTSVFSAPLIACASTMAAVAAELRSASACVAVASSCSGRSSRSKYAFRLSAATAIPARSSSALRSRPPAVLPPLRGSSFGGLSFCLRRRPLRASQRLSGDIPIDFEEDWEEGEEVDGEEDEAGGDGYPSDVESLEEEARKVAREFSLSISRELRRGTRLDTVLRMS